MKIRIGIFVVFVAVMAMVSCDPIENRLEPKGAVTEAEISQYVSITAEVRDGKRSNYLLLKSEGLKALTSFTHGLGTYVGTSTRVQGFVVPGDQEVTLTVLNADGTKITKTYNVNVEQCFDVAPEWALFCGTGSKAWTWDDRVPDPYGMGDAFGDYPNWWCPDIATEVAGEGWGATMTLSAVGATLTKNRTNSTVERGTFEFNMANRNTNWSKSIGKFTTRGATVLTAKDTGRNGTVYTFDILELTDDVLVLGKLDNENSNPNSDGWGQINFWMYRAK